LENGIIDKALENSEARKVLLKKGYSERKIRIVFHRLWKHHINPKETEDFVKNMPNEKWTPEL